MKKLLGTLPAILALSACLTTAEEPAKTSMVETDQQMTCQQISQETSQLDARLAEIDDANTATHATNVGTAIGGHAVGLAGLPIVGALIGHAGGVANMSAEERKEEAQDIEMRKNKLAGLSMGKGCQQPQALAAQPAAYVQPARASASTPDYYTAPQNTAPASGE